MTKPKGAIITYQAFNQNDKEELREVRFISKQEACGWLTEQWPSLQAYRGAVITDIQVDTPVFCTNSDIKYMDVAA